jgi:cation diffusion facilitator family transporter
MHPLSIAILCTLALGAGKLLIGGTTGSQAVIASAIDSLSDALISGLNLLMVRLAASPPDQGHPWGHGKAEALASLAQAVMFYGIADEVEESIRKALPDADVLVYVDVAEQAAT